MYCLRLGNPMVFVNSPKKTSLDTVKLDFYNKGTEKDDKLIILLLPTKPFQMFNKGENEIHPGWKEEKPQGWDDMKHCLLSRSIVTPECKFD